MRPSFDTNCLLRWVLEDIPEQAQLVESFIVNNQVNIADEAIIEMAFVLEKAYKLPRGAVADYLQLILTHANMMCSRAVYNAVLLIYTSHPALSFIDCYLVIKAGVEQKTPLYTFDKKLASQTNEAKLLR